jgi:hypothetical protein
LFTKFWNTTLGWLTGCWEGTVGGREYHEQWMKPAGGTMLGMSRTVSEERTPAWEFLRIAERDGSLFYIARPSGQDEAAFRLIKLGDGEAVFENPEHDFPQRVLYRLQDGGRLTAAIEGTTGGQMRRVDFPMRRVKCD